MKIDLQILLRHTSFTSSACIYRNRIDTSFGGPSVSLLRTSVLLFPTVGYVSLHPFPSTFSPMSS